ncbi:MAG: 4-(cytidine 5'-diphospho)-2-C-methyl-D-erythritol kinase [Helicobacteraceae bacterium]|jgi:4-diphosphocytidyl-2-C-methyl-D-erythritol kinase|nr:4-(cytidine 5'-diphospho)-2-C-methyl-D-erythritol kinase [Helicobacteraceae bacterium]
MVKVYSACAKVNIFLKIIGKREDGYHLIVSRFARLESLCDKLWFEAAGSRGFEVKGDFDCANEQNTISRSLAALARLFPSRKLFAFAERHRVSVFKQIPSGAGLGGASSDAAAFLHAINEEADLRLTNAELMEAGGSVGADIPFFLSGFKSANVRGIGDIVEEFADDLPEIAVKTPPIHCETTKVYQSFRRNFSQDSAFSESLALRLAAMKSREILEGSFAAAELNDLLPAALKIYPELLEYKEDGWFFSGSGGSFFRAGK